MSTDDVVTYPIKLDALTAVPVYERHSRGKTWFATIARNPVSPAGLQRTFHATAHGEFYYSVLAVEVGDPVEFGADYYSGSGRKQSKRWYGVVVGKTETELKLIQHDTAIKAIKAAVKLSGPSKEELEAKRAKLLKELQEVESQLDLLSRIY